MKSTTKYLIITVAVILVIAAIAAVGMMRTPPEQNDAPQQTTAPSNAAAQTPSASAASQQTAEPEIVKPTFMYFVSKSKESYEAAKKVYDELEAEYGDKVKFELKDVDAESDLKERFMIDQPDSPIPMNTPTLIMLDIHNDISTIGLSECTDKEVLKQAIVKALGE